MATTESAWMIESYRPIAKEWVHVGSIAGRFRSGRGAVQSYKRQHPGQFITGVHKLRARRIQANPSRVKFPSKFTMLPVRVNQKGEVQIKVNPRVASGGRFAKNVKHVESTGTISRKTKRGEQRGTKGGHVKKSGKRTYWRS